MDPIQLEDFKDIELYITDDRYKSDDPFAAQIKLKAKALKLAALRGRPKKRRIRKITEEKRPKKQYRCGYCKELGHNRKGCRNGRKEREVIVIVNNNSETSGDETSSGETSDDKASDSETSSDEASIENDDELA
jgi:hypothetical protein